jgi:hypothetical protein
VGEREGEDRVNSIIIRIKSCNSCELVANLSLNGTQFCSLYAWVTQIGDESGTSLGVELGVKDMVTFRNDFSTYEVNLIGSFNALVFIKKTKMIESFSDMSLPIQKKQKKKKVVKRIYVYVYLFLEISHIFPSFGFFFCLFLYKANFKWGLFNAHIFVN